MTMDNEEQPKQSQGPDGPLENKELIPDAERQGDDDNNKPAEPTKPSGAKKPRKTDAEKLAEALKKQAEQAVLIAKFSKDIANAKTADVLRLLHLLGEACFKVLKNPKLPKFQAQLDEFIRSHLGDGDRAWYSANCKSLLSHGLPPKSAKPPKSANTNVPPKDKGNQADGGASQQG